MTEPYRCWKCLHGEFKVFTDLLNSDPGIVVECEWCEHESYARSLTAAFKAISKKPEPSSSSGQDAGTIKPVTRVRVSLETPSTLGLAER